MFSAYYFFRMAGFDQGGVYYSDSLFNQALDQDVLASLQHAKKKFKDFLRLFNDGGFAFKYRFVLFLAYIVLGIS